MLLSFFYIAYLFKAFNLKQRGIAVNLLGKGEKPKSVLIIEHFLKVVTLIGAFVQFGSVVLPSLLWPLTITVQIRIVGIVLMLFGNLFFNIAMLTMRDNWRAGFNKNQDTNLITHGIYKISRNPAFVGFDLIYIGCTITFPNIINILVTVAAVLLFHFQILSEEEYCAAAFGQDYITYKTKTMRYFGVKR